MQPPLSTAANGGIPAGLRKKVYGGVEADAGASDMSGTDWHELIRTLTKFFAEEAREPEHAADDVHGPENEIAANNGAKSGPWPPPQVEKIPNKGHTAVSHFLKKDPEVSLDVWEEDDDEIDSAIEAVGKDEDDRRTLYVNRPLMNADEIVAWAKKAGFKKTLPPEDMHVTIAFSKAPLRWPEPREDHVAAEDANGTDLNGTRSIEQLGAEGAVVLRFECPELEARWNELRGAGASWDHPGYKPHVTISYEPGDVDLDEVGPFTGALEFGPEVFAEVDDDWAKKVKAKQIGSDAAPGPTAAGAVAITPRGEALFVRRCPGSDYPGTWCWPGGNLDAGEEARDAAGREFNEETGLTLEMSEHPFDRTKVGDADFATYAALVKDRSPIKLSQEHDDYKWASITDPPQPLHPGVKATLQRMAGLAAAKHAEDAKPTPEHVLHVEFNGDFDMREFLRALWWLGQAGASRTVEVASGDAETQRDLENKGYRTKFGWDGDGADKILSAEIDGNDVLAKGAADAALTDKEKSEGALGESDRSKIGEVGSEHREEMPASAFLEPGSKKYPVKERSAGGLKFNRRLLLAAARRARMNGKPAIAEKADNIRAREFSADCDCATDEAFDNLLGVFEQENAREPDREEYAAIDACARAWFEPKHQVATDTALRLALDKSDSVRRFDKDGRMHVEEANICKACVSPYRGEEIPGWESLGLDPNKIYQLLRDPEEIEKAAESANGIQILQQHIPVDADDHKPYDTVGSTGSRAKWDEPFLKNSLHFWTRPSIDDIESEAKRELSPGYHYRPDMTPGEWKGEKYDGVMRDIVFNHIAQVKDGRQGTDVVVGDSLPAVESEWRVVERALLEAAV